MRKFLAITAVLFCNLANAQQQISIGTPAGTGNYTSTGLATGDRVPVLKFVDLINSSQSEISLADLKGKITILEFWATWCGPCIPAMTHLAELKEQFKDNLEVIAISDETPERIKRFVQHKPSSILFASDPDHVLQKYFPFNAIPHTIVIDAEGKLAAVTSPGEISSKMIRSLIDGKKISLKEKKDAVGGFDMMKDYFPKSTDFNEYSFEVQPPVAGGFPITKRMSGTSPWYGRRLTMMNNPVSIIFRNAFEKSAARTIYSGVTAEEFDHRTTKNLYSIDVVVPKGKEKELYPYMQQQLLALDLPYKCKLEKRKMETIVITAADPSKLEALKSSGNEVISGGQPNIIKATSYNRKNVSLSDLFLHFENFGISKQPVMDETGLSGNFDLSFNLEVEDPNSFKNELAKLGLKAQRLEREVEVLVIYKD